MELAILKKWAKDLVDKKDICRCIISSVSTLRCSLKFFIAVNGAVGKKYEKNIVYAFYYAIESVFIWLITVFLHIIRCVFKFPERIIPKKVLLKDSIASVSKRYA